MAITTVFFDLDDTLYPPSRGLWELIRQRMHTYMQKLLNLPDEELAALREHYLETYGTTLRGLQMNRAVDTEDFLAYVHDLPLDQYLQPDPVLRELLLSLPKRRWIFTNADVNHARRVVQRLGVSDCFEGIIDIHAIQFASKPNLEAYTHALRIAGETNPQHCVYLDDAIRNLIPAYRLGFYTVWVGSNSPHPIARQSICNLLDLPQAMPWLWNSHPATQETKDG